MKYDNTDIHLRYDESRKLPEETKKLWLDSIVEYIPTGNVAAIIDLGCGTGRFIDTLSVYFPGTIHGVDPSMRMLAKAKEMYSDDRFSFTRSTGEALCFNGSSVDVVFLSQTYHHFHDQDRAISEIKRVLRPGGYVCIRNSVVENIDSCLYMKFFAGICEEDTRLLPPRKKVHDVLHHHDLDLIVHKIVHQKFAENLRVYYKKIKLRGLSDLALLSDEEFDAGLRKLDNYCRQNDSGEAVYEEMDLFIAVKR